MTASSYPGQPAISDLRGRASKKADIVWFAAVCGLCAGWLGYLFAPYIIATFKLGPKMAETGLIAIGLVVGVVVALLGGLAVARFGKE